MGLSEEELIQHCNLIRDWQIDTNKIVILCEGLIDNSQRCSPQQYIAMSNEQLTINN